MAFGPFRPDGGFSAAAVDRRPIANVGNGERPSRWSRPAHWEDFISSGQAGVFEITPLLNNFAAAIYWAVKSDADVCRTAGASVATCDRWGGSRPIAFATSHSAYSLKGHRRSFWAASRALTRRTC